MLKHILGLADTFRSGRTSGASGRCGLAALIGVMTSRRRVPLLLACLVSALACAQTTSAFSHGDLLLSSFSGKGLSTLQLVSYNAKAARNGAINIGKKILASKMSKSLKAKVAGLSSLAVSPDGKYAFALVYGTSGAFFTQANVVVVDIRSTLKRVVLVGRLPLPKGYRLPKSGIFLGGSNPVPMMDPAMAVGKGSATGTYTVYALLVPTSGKGSRAVVGSFQYRVSKRTFSYQGRYGTTAPTRVLTVPQQLFYVGGNVYTSNLDNVTASDFGTMYSLYALNKAHPRRLVRQAGINNLDGMAIVNPVKYYAALGSDLGVVSLVNTSMGLVAMQQFYTMAGAADPLATDPSGYNEFMYTIATTPTSSIIYLTLRVEEYTPVRRTVTRIRVISKGSFMLLHAGDTPNRQSATGWPTAIP